MSMEPLKTIKVVSHFEQGKLIPGKTVRIYYDEFPENPRTTFDNLGHMVCFHPRYNLGDKHIISTSEFSSPDELENLLIREYHAGVILPLTLFDHSGISMRIGRYGCKWDSSFVGFIYVTEDEVIREYGDLSEESKKRAANVLKIEIEEYDAYLTGDVYRYESEDENGNELESVGGFLGYDAGMEGIAYYADIPVKMIMEA